MTSSGPGRSPLRRRGVRGPLGGAARELRDARWRSLAPVLGADPAVGAPVLRDEAAALLAQGPDAVWLIRSVLHAELPEPLEVQALARRVELDGAAAVLAHIEATIPAATGDRDVEVVSDRVLVDVHQLLATPFTTGIQRVAQELVRRWARDHDDVLQVAWTGDARALRRTTAAERRGRTITEDGHPPEPGTDASPRPTVLVPWRATYVLPELALDPTRTTRIRGLAMHARSRTAAVAFDMVPITAAWTTDRHVPSQFSHQLTALRHVDRVAAISRTTATEYEGWRRMTSATGLAGPEVVTVPLPAEAGTVTDEDLAHAARRYLDPRRPLVLAVGSHEPRKNHLAVLHAAELLWRDGHDFSLLFVGGNAWSSASFVRRLTELAAAGRPVESVAGLGDVELWSLYRLARCTVFPSLAEGFGLPVAESLAVGTPVVTSSFGSMAEIAQGGGALLVDPRDDHALADAIGTLLRDDTLHARLRAEATARPVRRWDEYARELWDALVR